MHLARPLAEQPFPYDDGKPAPFPRSCKDHKTIPVRNRPSSIRSSSTTVDHLDNQEGCLASCARTLNTRLLSQPLPHRTSKATDGAENQRPDRPNWPAPRTCCASRSQVAIHFEQEQSL